MLADDSSSRVNVLGKYVDGLHVSLFGDPKHSVFEDLEATKGVLLDSPLEVCEFDSVAGGRSGPLFLTTQGDRKFPFVLKSDAIRHLSLSTWAKLPQVMIQFKASPLHEYALDGVEDIVRDLGCYFLEGDFEVKVGRFDLAVDFQWPEWRWPEIENVISRARKRTKDYEGRLMTGMTFGKGGQALQVQIYDKSHETKVHNNWWIAERWATKEAYDEGMPVIRVELRFLRNLLREFKREDPLTGELGGIGTISELRSSMGDLVSYVLGDGSGKGTWIRVASRETRDRESDRRPAAPWWESISEAFLNGMPETGRVRRRSARSIPNFERDLNMSITYAVKAAGQARAWGIAPTGTPEEFFRYLAENGLRDWFSSKDFGSWEEAVAHEEAKTIVSEESPLEHGLAV